MFAITERLLLRPGWPEDAQALACAIGHEAIARNLARLPWPYSKSDADWFLANAFAPQTGVYLIILRHTSKIIGGIGIHPDPDDPSRAELGYWIAQDHWGCGYATEAGRSVIANARETQRLTGLCSAWFIDNPASGRVLEKLGFQRTGEIVPRMSTGRSAEVQTVLMELAG